MANVTDLIFFYICVVHKQDLTRYDINDRY